MRFVLALVVSSLFLIFSVCYPFALEVEGKKIEPVFYVFIVFAVILYILLLLLYMFPPKTKGG